MAKKISSLYSSFSKIINKLKYKLETQPLRQLDDAEYINYSYQIILRRKPDIEGQNHFSEKLKLGEISREGFLDVLVNSAEFQRLLLNELGQSIHQSRIQWVKTLPQAKHIVDLGGSSKGNSRGALIAMGYPYSFEKLTIIDLPLEQRDPLYSQGYEQYNLVETEQGSVQYVYTSMSDLSCIPDNSIDLVNSGQSIEHIYEQEAEAVFSECMRVLKPGGYLCVDTPNGKATRLQQDAFIDPDHKIEYTHQQLYSKLKASGFANIQPFGFNYLPNSFAVGQFDTNEATKNVGIYSDAEHCYILAYRCQKPK
ncbi:methyltransferase domain-containing protein [Romeria aff. gracilis LEGE 07310]|uniref:Methyltransferase domain-containing protein n=1 Tax=Vasconcelosia minhoensis LEGE 07310 TaxID=915328 RepID=A0A8J7DDJ3_9CYAN|nr:methyltransferase domain-containing protein [Romeria gracilis]MBE9079942.1 methyltransferase domain-containing protein [Romeria aff. gracilis LEGE 07310]